MATAECALDAFGITALTQGFSLGIKWAIKQYGIKGALKTIGKFAAKYVGWVGLAWTMYDFAECVYTGD